MDRAVQTSTGKERDFSGSCLLKIFRATEMDTAMKD